MEPTDLPDRVHIEALRDALWAPESRATVLVGAGMSRNADRVSPAVRPFPLWWETGEALLSALHLQDKSVPVPRLGQMYENTFGRDRLDDLLLDLIPDGKYEPSRLHERLLILPWSDVFTTNYDTLLERTAPRVPQVKYEIVNTPDDLTRAERPRIVKLHGSFPSHRPFIFTEEDYRKYPITAAPFVNLVRQSAMENILCMIGFSGEDPNFQQWAGWIRDQLGNMAPRMYLCGALDLGTPGRSYFRHMQVVPVDLGPLFPRSHWGSGDERHRAALEWLIETLAMRRRREFDDWPTETREDPRSESRLPAPLPSRNAPPLKPPSVERKAGELDMEELKRLMAVWAYERTSYPQWPVCPEHAIWSLWNDSHGWLARLQRPQGVALVGAQPVVIRGDILREIAWRFRTLLLPISDSLVPLIDKWLEEVNPRPKLIDSPNALNPDNAQDRGVPGMPWERLVEIWVELAFARVRQAWLTDDWPAFAHWIDKLAKIADSRSDWRALWWFERCWHDLIRLDLRQLREHLAEWPEDLTLPYWEAKRAAFLADLGEYKQAQQVAGKALDRVRLGRDRKTLDVRSLSEEGWILHLLNRIAMGDHFNPFKRDYIERDRRLSELRRDRCDPEEDWAQRQRALPQVAEAHQNRHFSFDPGTAVISSHSGSWRSEEWRLLLTAHDGALPYSGSFPMVAALKRTWRDAPRLSLALTLVGGHGGELSEGSGLAGIVGRARIACMDAGHITDHFNWLLPILRDALQARHRVETQREQKLRQRLVIGTMDILSRLAFRLNREQLADLFDLACAFHSSRTLQSEFPLLGGIHDLFRRTLRAVVGAQLQEWLLRLLRLPVVDEPGTDFAHGHLYNDPWAYVAPGKLKSSPPSLPQEAVPELERLLRLTEAPGAESGEARWRASMRLAVLLEMGVLTPGDKQRFSNAVWGLLDEKGYPAGVGFLPPVLLELPEPTPGVARDLVVRRLTAPVEDDRHEEEKWMQSLRSTAAPLAQVWPNATTRTIVWTPDEAKSLLGIAADLWSRRRQPRWALLEHAEFGAQLCGTVSRAIAPFLAEEDLSVGGALMGLIKDMRDKGINVTAALPISLLAGAIDVEAACTRLHAALTGGQADEVKSATWALVTWSDLGVMGRVPVPPAWLFDCLCASAEVMRRPGLIYILDSLTALVFREQSVLEERHLQSLSRALGRILDAMSIDKMRADLTWDDELGFDADERVAVLAEASELAASLHQLGIRRNLHLPAVAEWQKFAAAQPLPEVRDPWTALGGGQ